MKYRTISVTEASRNFAECVDKVRYQGLSFLFLKNGTPVARLIPIEDSGSDFSEQKKTISIIPESAPVTVSSKHEDPENDLPSDSPALNPDERLNGD